MNPIMTLCVKYRFTKLRPFSAQNLCFLVRNPRVMGQFFPVHYLAVLILLDRSAAKFYPISKKNLDDFFWKWKKLEILSENFSNFFRNFWEILRFLNFSKFSKNFDFFNRKSYTKFSKISKNFKIFKISEFRKFFAKYL